MYVLCIQICKQPMVHPYVCMYDIRECQAFGLPYYLVGIFVATELLLYSLSVGTSCTLISTRSIETMGCCSSCCGSSEDGESSREMELQAQKSRKALSISRSMSAPTIVTREANVVSGTGLALAGVSIEQDAAYWEWHIRLGVKDTLENILFGVATKKDASFYQGLKDKVQPEEGTNTICEFSHVNGACILKIISTWLFTGTPSDVDGTQFMRRIAVENGDVIGVSVQQSDLPMVQFTLNGEELHISAINRFRGAVYPSVFLPEAAKDLKAEVTLVTSEQEFRQQSPGDRFLPLIVARSVV